jgi:hypothetical protein
MEASSTIGDEKRSNAALTLGADDYVSALVAGLDAVAAPTAGRRAS